MVMKRVVLLNRVSTTSQSTERQLRDLTELCNNKSHQACMKSWSLEINNELMRNGNLVFETNNILEGWNGNFLNKKVTKL